ncbi:MAG: hypothetical protein FWD23_07265 [Oscillospiraceae bacterium]|nr:hypothetical protein [Oscillospiraceae bacterium]
MRYSKRYGLYLPEMTDPPNQMANTANFEKLDDLLYDGLYPMGEIRITRNPAAMPPNWLLCNGGIINSGKYPLVEPLLQDRRLGFDYNWTESPDVRTPIVCAEVAGTKWWVALPDASVGGTGVSIKYTSGSLLTGPWTTKTIENNTAYGALGIKFLNGYFVIYGGTGHLGDNLSCIWSVLGAPTGTWTRTAIGSGADRATSIDYGNGFWCVGRDNGYGAYLQGESPQGSWVCNFVSGEDVKFADNYWVGAKTNNTVIWFKQGAPNDTWSTILVGTTSDRVSNIEHGGGFWLTDNGFYVQGNPDSLPAGTWPKNPGWTAYFANGFAFAKDRWVTGKGGSIEYIVGNPSGSVQTKIFSQINSVRSVGYQGDTWLMNGDGKLFFAVDGYRLPDIPIPDAYAYIKVAEAA